MRFLIFCTLIVLFGCLARPMVKKADSEIHLQQNKIIEQAVQQTAKSGDWLVIRGYKAVDNLVAAAAGIPLSHAGVYDAEAGTVIEAEGKGVHETSLAEFVDKSYRLLIIRPRWRTEANADSAVSNAKKLTGKSYDFLGTIGFDAPGRYYCSELAVYIYKDWHNKNEKFPKVIKPGELYLYGKVLYDSRPRDEF